MGMEGQIMCVEQCTFWMSSVAFLGPENAPKSLADGALPQTHWGAYSAPPDTVAGFKGPTCKATTSKKREREGKRGERRQNDLCPGHQIPSRRHCVKPKFIDVFDVHDNKK